MAGATTLGVVKGPARLVLNPTDFTTTFPYGGTQLGLARGCEFRYGTKVHVERAQEWGNAPVRALYCGDGDARLAAVLRSWDVDALNACWPTSAAGASGSPLVSSTVNGSVRSGKVLSGSAILLVPLDSPGVLPAVYLPNALPRPDEAAALLLSRKTEAGVAVWWEAAPDSAGRAYIVGLLADMTP